MMYSWSNDALEWLRQYAQGDAGSIPDYLVQRSVLGDMKKGDVSRSPIARLNDSQ